LDFYNFWHYASSKGLNFYLERELYMSKMSLLVGFALAGLSVAVLFIVYSNRLISEEKV